MEQGPSHGHALLLAAGELGGPAARLVAQADALEDLPGPPQGIAPVAGGEEIGQGHVVEGVEVLEKMEVLENEAHRPVAETAQLAVVHGPQILPVDDGRARIARIQSADDVQEGRLAGARSADDTDEGPGFDGQAYAAQGGRGRFALAVDAGDVGQFDHAVRFTSPPLIRSARRGVNPLRRSLSSARLQRMTL